MMMKRHFLAAFTAIAFMQLPQSTLAASKNAQIQQCLGFLQGQEQYCCNYIQTHTPRQSTTITTSSTSIAPALTTTVTSTAFTTDIVSETDTVYDTVTATFQSTSITTTETDTITKTTTTVIVPPGPSIQTATSVSAPMSRRDEELEKRGWLESKLKYFEQEIIFDACKALLQFGHYSCPALPPITSTVKTTTTTTLPLSTKANTITNTVDSTTKTTTDITQTATTTSIDSISVTTSTVQATKTNRATCGRCTFLESNGCAPGCISDCDTDGNSYCAEGVAHFTNSCNTNADCPPGYHCSVGTVCANTGFNCVMLIPGNDACVNPTKREFSFDDALRSFQETKRDVNPKKRSFLRNPIKKTLP